jgi:hypothetical protein
VKQKVICVLGMHRSGTSCLAGTLAEAKVSFGDVSKNNPHNPKGNYENLKIMDLHNDLLADNGGSWNSPPEFVRWSDNHKLRRDAIIRDYEHFSCWGFKDPRSLLTIEGWIEALPDISFIASFRNPLLVAQSMLRRSRIPIEKGLQLWTFYNKKLLKYHEEFGFPMISFDLEGRIYRKKLSGLLSRFGLSVPSEQLNFFSPDMRHTEIGDVITLPAEAAEIYEKLKTLAI